MSKYEQKPFIYCLDFLSGTPGIFISGRKRYTTLFGLITTLIIVAFSILHIIYQLYLFFFEREMTIVQLNDNFMTNEINIPLNNFLFAFNVFNKNVTMKYFWGKEINLQSGNISRIPLNKNYTVNFYYENPENKEIINKYELELEYCEIGKNINQELINKYNFTEFKNYLCLSNTSKNFNIIINKTHNTYINIVISLKIENASEYGIKEISSDDFSTIYELSYLEFQLYSPNDIITNKNISNPIKLRKNFLNYELVSSGVLEHYEINTKFIYYSSDDGIFFKNKKKFKCFSIDSITRTAKDLERFEEFKNFIYSEFRLYLNPDNIESYERTYQKLTAVIADISGILSLFFTIGKFFVEFFCKTFLEVESISRIFRFKFSASSKTKFKQNNNNKLQNTFDNESSLRGIKNSYIDNISQKSEIMNNKNNKNNINIGNNSQNNILNLINNNLSKKISVDHNKNNSSKELSIKGNISQNQVNNKDNNSYSLNNNISGNNFKKFESIQYLEVFLKIIGKNNIEKERKRTNPNSFSLCEYFSFIFNKKKNNKSKIIKKVSDYFENSLSIEDIIERKIELEIIVDHITKKLRKGLNLKSYVNILLKNDSEFKQIIEDEKKQIITNNLVK